MGAGAAEDWTRDDVNAQLARILRSPEFERNKSAAKILAFVVEETLEGRGARLKAYTIGVEIFAREGTFDAQNNSIVRVQAARLRQLLDIYYAGVGAGDPIDIRMPVGGYRVIIARTAADDAPEAQPAEDALRAEWEAAPQEAAIPAVSRPERAPRDRRFSFCAVALAVALGLLLLQRAGPLSQAVGVTEPLARPKVLVQFAVQPGANAKALEKLANSVERPGWAPSTTST